MRKTSKKIHLERREEEKQDSVGILQPTSDKKLPFNLV
jgi:hypothetical protein